MTTRGRDGCPRARDRSAPAVRRHPDHGPALDGELQQDDLRRERITIDELQAEARRQQVTSLAEVRLAVLETSGRISVIPEEG